MNTGIEFRPTHNHNKSTCQAQLAERRAFQVALGRILSSFSTSTGREKFSPQIVKSQTSGHSSKLLGYLITLISAHS